MILRASKIAIDIGIPRGLPPNEQSSLGWASQQTAAGIQTAIEHELGSIFDIRGWTLHQVDILWEASSQALAF